MVILSVNLRTNTVISFSSEVRGKSDSGCFTFVSMNTILIADREPAQRRQIRQYVNSHAGFRVVGECGSCHDTIRYVNSLEPDVLFLDVQLGGGRTFDLIQQIAHLPKLIYMAKSESYALKAFDHQAFDYLLKPCPAERVDAALRKVADRSAADLPQPAHTPFAQRRNLFVEDGERLRRIATQDIRFLKAAGDYTVIYTGYGEFLSTSGIGHIERQLDAAQFLRVHRSYIVNVDRVDTCYRAIGRFYLVMENGQEIGVGKNYLSHIRSLIL